MADGASYGPQLRGYQIDSARALWRSLVSNNNQSTLLVAPTGSGKTVIAAFLMQKLLEHLHWDILFLAPRREIVHQTCNKLTAAGVWPGLLMAGEVKSLQRPVQVASVDSYLRWRGRKIVDHAPRLVVVDEAHRGLSRSMKKLLDQYRGEGSKVLGMTATPIRSDGQGLGRLFTDMVCTPDVAELTGMGFLVPMEYYVGIIPDTKGVKLVAGDYSQDELTRVLDQDLLVGDVVDNYSRLGRGRKTLLFASGVQHSLHLRDRLRAAGFAVEHIDGQTPKKDRDAVHEKLVRGELDVVCNANVYVEGTDIPEVSCIIDAQPTKSFGRYRQKAGRGLRTSDGKVNCLYLDHAGNVYEHGRVEESVEWRLTQGRESAMIRTSQPARGAPVERGCERCGHLFAGHTCPRCGQERSRKARMADTLDGALTALDKPDAPHKPTEAEMQRWYQEALGQVRAWGKKDGMAAYAYQAKFGSLPPYQWGRLPAEQPSDPVRSYLRSRLIRAAKSVKAYRLSAA